MLSVSTFFKEEKDPMYQRGAEKGKLEGKLQGKLEGKLEGKTEEKNEIALEMKKHGFTIEQIASITKLTAKEIKDL